MQLLTSVNPAQIFGQATFCLLIGNSKIITMEVKLIPMAISSKSRMSTRVVIGSIDGIRMILFSRTHMRICKILSISILLVKLEKYVHKWIIDNHMSFIALCILSNEKTTIRKKDWTRFSTQDSKRGLTKNSLSKSFIRLPKAIKRARFQNQRKKVCVEVLI